MTVLDVLPLPEEMRRRPLEGAAVAVIDVLRAGTTIVAALAGGSAGILPVAGEEEARSVAEELRGRGEHVLLCGEVRGFPPDGFDLGNSPREFTTDRVKGAKIVLKTTNGTTVLAQARSASITVAAGLTNLSAVARFLVSQPASPGVEQLVCVCAGREGKFSLEDFYAAGGIVDFLVQSRKKGVPLGHPANVAMDYFRWNRHNPLGVLSRSTHGRWLQANGLGEDLAECATVDKYAVVPVREHDGWLRGRWL